MCRLLVRFSRFCRQRGGNVAMIYAVALVPLAIAIGGGIDFARAALVRTALSEALDGAALALGASNSAGLSDAQALALVQAYFDANYRQSSDYGTPSPVSLSREGQNLLLSAAVDMPTSVLKITGMKIWPVSASSTVVWGQTKLWVSLVLDNTGSMAQTDNAGVSKISALKTASHQLLAMLQNAARNSGDVQAAIIPFARNVKIGTGYDKTDWLSFTDFIAAPPTPSSSAGPGKTCPWTDSQTGYHCTSGPANGAQTVSTIPANGSYKGYICPSATKTGHYWNGCFNSVSNGSGGWNHTWIANATTSWSGCVTDRAQNYDTNAATPAPETPASMMVAENSPSCPAAAILPLGYDWSALSSKVDAMAPSGSTNQTIGLVWGWHAMTQGAPLTPPALPDQTQRVIILLSDGLNTQNRWSGDGSKQSSAVDQRMALACANAKADGITIYSVFVDLNGTQGNSSVLKNCASDSSKYFDLTSSGQIVTAFATIGQQITNLHVAQ